MSTISACKASLTKALTALETTRGKIPQDLVSSYSDESLTPADERQLLDRRQEALRAHLSNMRAALRIVREKQQSFLTFVTSSSNSEVDNEAYMDYMQQSKIEDAMVAAETLIHTLHANLEKVCARLESLRSVIQSNTQEVRENTTIEVDPCFNMSQPAQLTFPQTSPRDTPPFGAADTNSATFTTQQGLRQPTVQLGKLTLEPFTGDITQFQRFWRAFEVAIHEDNTISTTYKFLYLQSLLKGEAQIVLQDLDPDECNYFELVRALKKRYDRPHKTRAILHRQLQQLPTAGNSGTDLRNTWFRLSGILRGLRKFEDFRTVLPILDLVRSKFPPDIQQKLHDLEFHSGGDFNLYQIMTHVDHIIASKEKYEDTTTLKDSYSINSSHGIQRARPRSQSPRNEVVGCAFCGTQAHRTRNCSVKIPAEARINIVRVLNLCWKCLNQGHSSRTCRYPKSKHCAGDHHELLCRNRQRYENQRRSPCRYDTHRSRRYDYERNSQSYRSPSKDGYSSRSPSQERYRRRSYTDDEHSRSPSWDERHRDCSPRSYSPAKRYSRSPHRVSFSNPPHRRSYYSPVRDTQAGWRSGSPHPITFQHQAQDSDAEFEQLNQCYHSHRVRGAATKANLMLVNAKAFNYDHSKLEEVVLLLDSGAQNRFITTSAANRLGLPIYDKKERTFATFGGLESTEMTGVVDVDLLDMQDRVFQLHLTSKDVITLPQSPPKLSDTDSKFIRVNRFRAPSCHTSHSVLPDILVGIDSYWDVLVQEPPVCLPSGMVLTHTRFGTVVSGNSVFHSGFRKAQRPTNFMQRSTQTMSSQDDSGHLTH